jgi:hypothetical protein
LRIPQNWTDLQKETTLTGDDQFHPGEEGLLPHLVVIATGGLGTENVVMQTTTMIGISKLGSVPKLVLPAAEYENGT